MKRSALVLLSAILLFSVSSTAFATGFDPLVELYADCTGFRISGTLNDGISTEINFYYTIYLYEDGIAIYEKSSSDVIYPETDPNFLYEGIWDMELCGDYNVVLWVKWIGQYTGTKKLLTDFTCDCGIETCTYTPGFWKNHGDEWPAEGLTVGCDYYTKEVLIDILKMDAGGGNIGLKLFHHLVAAKLNVLVGADDYIMDAITAGDDFLCSHDISVKLVGDARDDAEAIKDDLEEYNEIECEEEDDDMLMIDSAPKITVNKAAAATEESSWGSIKKKHQ